MHVPKEVSILLMANPKSRTIRNRTPNNNKIIKREENTQFSTLIKVAVNKIHSKKKTKRGQPSLIHTFVRVMGKY